MTSDPPLGGAVLRAGVTPENADLALVLLHGRGASAEDILGLGSAFGVPNVTCLAPQAAGYTWYPLSFMAPRAANEPYITSALAKVESIIRSLEQAGLEREKIVVAGFSQGACLATGFVATHPARYGGLIAFTGGLIGSPGRLSYSREAKLAGMPALLCSGDPDPHVPWARVEESASILVSMGAEVTLRRYPGRPHSITREELDLARRMLLQIAGG